MKYWMIAAVVGVALLLVPVKVRCGSPGAACAMPPAPGGTAPRYYYEYEPLGVGNVHNLASYRSRKNDRELARKENL